MKKTWTLINLNNYLKITAIINDVFRPQTAFKKTRIKLYSTLALPSMLHGKKKWTIKTRDPGSITAAEMKNIRKQQDRVRQIIEQTQILQKN